MKSNRSLSIIPIAFLSLSILSGCGPSSQPNQQSGNTNADSNTTASRTPSTQHANGHEGSDDHHHDKVPGPNGGRLVVNVEPHFEFLVLPDHHAQITFVNDEIQPIPAADLQINLAGGDRSNPVEISFEKKDTILISTQPLPKQNNIPVVLQISGGQSKETKFERFHLNMETCPDCDLHEYACICGHSVHHH